jgi:hypothetical protein
VKHGARPAQSLNPCCCTVLEFMWFVHFMKELSSETAWTLKRFLWEVITKSCKAA